MNAARRLAVVLVVLCCAGVPASAQAQLDTPYPGISVPDAGAMIAQDTFLRQALGSSGTAAREGRTRSRKPRARKDRPKPKPKPKPRPTARQRATLRFGADPSVSAKVDRRFIDDFAAPGVDPAVVVADLANLRRASAGDLRRWGWSTRNLGDVAAYALVASYAWHRGSPKVSAAGTRMVRRALADELASRRSIRRLSDRRQQEIAEILLLRVGYYVGWGNDRAARGDEPGVADIRHRLATFVRGVFGIDVTAVTLGRKGFASR
jgi:hypothetical protein